MQINSLKINKITIAASALMMVTSLSAHAQQGMTPEDAVAADNRSETHEARDAGRKPAMVMDFFEVESGQTVLDIAASSGYYTRILSNIVGEEGLVIAQNSPNASEEARTNFAAQFSDAENVDPVFANLTDLDVEDGSLDRAFLFRLYHHWHYRPATGEAMVPASRDNLNFLFAKLKPGGVFGVIDHVAAEGTTRATSADLHRVPEQMAIDDITAAGFEFVGSAEFLKNEDDNVDERWFSLPSDTSSRWVHYYRKPS